MADDIVKRLRQWALVKFTWPALHNLPTEMAEAADEIERLRAELYRCDMTCHYERLEQIEREARRD